MHLASKLRHLGFEKAERAYNRYWETHIKSLFPGLLFVVMLYREGLRRSITNIYAGVRIEQIERVLDQYSLFFGEKSKIGSPPQILWPSFIKQFDVANTSDRDKVFIPWLEDRIIELEKNPSGAKANFIESLLKVEQPRMFPECNGLYWGKRVVVAKSLYSSGDATVIDELRDSGAGLQPPDIRQLHDLQDWLLSSGTTNG